MPIYIDSQGVQLQGSVSDGSIPYDAIYIAVEVIIIVTSLMNCVMLRIVLTVVTLNHGFKGVKVLIVGN